MTEIPDRPESQVPTGAIESLLEAPDPVVDKRLNLLVVVTACFTALIVVIAIVTLIRTWATSNDTDAIERGNRIASCRSLLNSELVGIPTTDLQVAEKEADQADRALSRARADLDVIETDLLEAAAFENVAALGPIAERFDEAQTVVLDAVEVSALLERQVDEHATALDQGRAENTRLVQLSISDPDAFLERCEEES